jgi:ketosteroid isomerase-like protein
MKAEQGGKTMKRFTWLSALSAVAVSLACVPFMRRASGGDDARHQSEREIRELEAQFSRAVVTGDRAFYERVLAPDFTHTSHSGVFKTRAQWLAEPRPSDRVDPKAAAARYEAFDVDDLAVRIYGDTAVVTGRTTPRGRTAKGEAMTSQYRFIRIWVKQQAKWQVVAFEGTRIAQP